MSGTVSLQQVLSQNTRASAPELVQPLAGKQVRCLACGHRCLIRPNRAGVCKVRFNDGGTLRVPWGYVAGVQVDPIEKKPFFHVLPGRDALSFGMLGCDLHCSYCQNWISSQTLRDAAATAEPRFVSPERLVDTAVQQKTPVMVSTYNEPLITADWAVEVFKLARQAGILCGFVSNGNATPEVLEFIRPYVDLYKIDLKGFDDKHYRQLGGVLGNVLDSIERVHRMGFWLEVVTLLVPGFNDSDEEIRKIADFLAGVSVDIPWHVTAFRPQYKMLDRSGTPPETLIRAVQAGRRAGLRYVYAGNLPSRVGDSENTVCPSCGEVVIRRVGFTVVENRMRGSACGACGATLPGVWEDQVPPVRPVPAFDREPWGC